MLSTLIPGRKDDKIEWLLSGGGSLTSIRHLAVSQLLCSLIITLSGILKLVRRAPTCLL